MCRWTTFSPWNMRLCFLSTTTHPWIFPAWSPGPSLGGLSQEPTGDCNMTILLHLIFCNIFTKEEEEGCLFFSTLPWFNKFSSHPSFFLSVNFFCTKTLRTWASLNPKISCAGSDLALGMQDSCCEKVVILLTLGGWEKLAQQIHQEKAEKMSCREKWALLKVLGEEQGETGEGA